MRHGTIILRGSTYPHRQRLQSLGFRWSSDTKRWTMPQRGPLDERAADNARALPGVDVAVIEDPPAPVLEDRMLWQRHLIASPTRPWDHQVDGFNLIEQRDRLLLNWEMGTGKTKPVIDWICNQHPKWTLIVCPVSVRQVWIDEFYSHGRMKNDDGVKLVHLHPLGHSGGTIAKDAQLVTRQHEAGVLPMHSHVFIVNYERIWRDPLAKLMLHIEWDLAVCDEIHRIKGNRSRASKYMWKLADTAKKKLGLTGTLMPHSPMDVFSQMMFLDPTLFGKSFVRFRSRYAVMGGFQQKQIVRWKNLDDMAERLKQVTDRVTKDEVLDLPPVIHEDRVVDLSPPSARVYRSMERAFVADVEEGKVTAGNALAKLLRLQQITSGFAPVEDADGKKVTVEDLGGEKQRELESVLEEIEPHQPVVVFGRFTHDLASVCAAAEATGRRYMELSGRSNELKKWQEGPYGGEVLGVQIQSGGVGVAMTRACYCVYFSVGFNRGDYEQSLARLHRGGQTRPVTYIHLIARRTVDQRVYRALALGKNLVESVTQELTHGTSD